MLPIQKLELRSSEIKSRLSDLAATEGELSEEHRSEMERLVNESKDIETRRRALIVSGDIIPPAIEARDDTEGRDMRRLLARGNVGQMLANIAEQQQHTGAEAELQQHYQLPIRSIPLAMLRRFDDPELETRAAATIPSTVNSMQHESLRYVFPMSQSAFLGIAQETVSVGDAIFPILTSDLTVTTPARSAAGTETTAVFTAETLTPRRLQASLRYTREDKARFLLLDSDLRENLSMGLQDGLDKEVIQGTNGLLGTGGLTVRSGDGAAEATFSTYRGLLYDSDTLDGRYADQASSVRMLMGAATYAHCGASYRTANSDISAVENLLMNSGGVRISANIPAPASDVQAVLVSKGTMRRNMVSALWQQVDIIFDEITAASTGEVILTAFAMFAVKIIDQAGFEYRSIQVA